MRTIVFLLAVLFSSVAGAGNPLLPGVKGKDDRILVQSIEYPWSAIGRLNKSIGGFCTGTLIGPKLVLTAAHCLWNRKTRRYMPAQSMHFVAGYRGGDYLQHSRASALFVPAAYRPTAPGSASNLVNDWALVSLVEPVGQVTGYLAVAGMDARRLTRLRKAGTAFVQSGYSKDKAHVLSVHLNCPLKGFVRGRALIAHTCDAVPGDSGSPIFFFDGKRFTIAAIHVATTRKVKPALGLAVPAVSFLGKIRESLSPDGHAPPPGTLQPVTTSGVLLSRFGYKVDGDLAAAVGAFQKAEGLTVDGKVNPTLVGRLFQALRRRP